MSAMTPGTRVTLQAPQGCLTRGYQDGDTGMPIDGGFLVVKNGAKGTIVGSSGAASCIVQFDALKGVAVSLLTKVLVEDVAETDKVPCILCGNVRAKHPVVAHGRQFGVLTCSIFVPEIRE